MLLRGYLGRLGRLRVLGRWKWTVVRTLVFTFVCVPFRTAFLAFSASTLAFEALAKGRGHLVSLLASDTVGNMLCIRSYLLVFSFFWTFSFGAMCSEDFTTHAQSNDRKVGGVPVLGE